jgi:hypothetical protein
MFVHCSKPSRLAHTYAILHTRTYVHEEEDEEKEEARKRRARRSAIKARPKGAR